jgi:hypothetical protein
LARWLAVLNANIEAGMQRVNRPKSTATQPVWWAWIKISGYRNLSIERERLLSTLLVDELKQLPDTGIKVAAQSVNSVKVNSICGLLIEQRNRVPVQPGVACDITDL